MDSKGDSYDNALAETINGLYKATGPSPGTMEDQEGSGEQAKVRTLTGPERYSSS